eukprot:TRINITY_DN786_c0_g2_i1.p2 TRINITY_DN786_c0_g2~~TRINITY_DN786_c0_g2_i1.p2  ORF type:complete len:132 (-),score=73.15 TRINITY_DN786_c0_g2_i1:124-465(-)
MAEVPLPEPKAVRTVRIELPDLDDGEGMHPLDPVAMMRANRKSVQIQALIGAEARFLRHELADCYLREGVNQAEVCAPLAAAYYDMLKIQRVFPQRVDHMVVDNGKLVKHYKI